MHRLRLRLLLALALTACADDPGCDRDGCAPGAFCLEAGSDIAGEGSTFTCVPTPAACTAEADCACLATAAANGDRPSGFNLAFCFDEGRCVEGAAGPVVSCPGG